MNTYTFDAPLYELYDCNTKELPHSYVVTFWCCSAVSRYQVGIRLTPHSMGYSKLIKGYCHSPYYVPLAVYLVCVHCWCCRKAVPVPGTWYVLRVYRRNMPAVISHLYTHSFEKRSVKCYQQGFRRLSDVRSHCCFAAVWPVANCQIMQNEPPTCSRCNASSGDAQNYEQLNVPYILLGVSCTYDAVLTPHLGGRHHEEHGMGTCNMVVQEIS